MNPDLVKALSALLAKQAQVEQTGVDISDQDRDEFIRAKTGGKFGWKDAAPLVDPSLNFDNIARSFGEGALGNYGTTIQSHMPSTIAGVSTGAGPDAAAVARAREEAFHNAHPYADLAGKVAGNVALLGLPWGKIAEAIGLPVEAASRILPAAHTVAGTAVRGALQGGAIGALDESGAGQGVEDRIKRGLAGGAIGATGGGLFGAAAGKVLSTIGTKGVAARRIADAIEKSGGVPALKSAAQDMGAANRGDVAMLGDLSPHMQQATDFAANNNPNTYSDLATKLNARQEGMGARLQGDVADLVGAPNATDKLAQLQASNKAWADQAYDNLRQLNPEVPLDHIEPLTQQPKVSGAFGAANETGQIGTSPEQPYVPGKAPNEMATKGIGNILTGGAGGEAPDPSALMQKLQDPIMQQQLRAFGHGDLLDAALGTNGTSPSFRSLLNLRGRLNGLASSAFQRGDGDLGTRLMQVHDALTDHLRAKVPGFADINDEFAARKRLEEALQSGVSAWDKPTTRSMAGDLAKLNPQEQSLYRQGVASQLIDWLRSIPRNQNVAGRIVNTSDAMQDKLKAVFGDEATFDNYMARAKAERTMATTKNAVGGSATHRRDAEAMFDPIESLFGGNMLPSTRNLWPTIMRLTTGKLNQNVAAQMGKQLSTTGVDNINNLLDTFTPPGPPVGPRLLRAGSAFPWPGEDRK